MQKIFGVALDTAGNAIGSATVTVTLTNPSSTLATLYSDTAYTAKANPFTTDSDGTYEFYVANGRYDLTLVKGGYTFDVASTTDLLVADNATTITPAQITAQQDNYAPANAINAAVWRLSSDAARSITGIAAPALGGAAGLFTRRMVLVNVGSFPITLVHNSASSSAANRFNFGGSPIVLGPAQSIELWYDGPTSLWWAVDGQPDVGVRVYHSSDQTIVDNTLTAILFGSELWDTGAIHNVSTNTNRLTCVAPGKYLIIGNVRWEASATGRRVLAVRHNETTTIASAHASGLDANAFAQTVSTIYPLAIGEFVDLIVLQTSGGNLKVLTNNYDSPQLMMQLLARA